jgi:acetyltransferase
MDKIFNPNSIAVIGVSERPTNMGRNIVANLLDFGYRGEIHVVGQREGIVFGHRLWRNSAASTPP